MALTISLLDSSKEKIWDDLVKSSSFGTLFHTVEWLKLVKEQTNAEYLPIMFYKGSQLIAIYPVFIQKKGPIKLALSPPSRSYILYLGPVISDYESMKQDKKESIYIQIQEELDNYLFKNIGCKYARIRSSPGLFDSRPLRWAGYNIDSYYTYRINLKSDINQIWDRFDKSVRRMINQAQEENIIVRTGDQNDLGFIHDLLYQRYIEQGLKPTDYKDYLLKIYKKFYPENLKIFVAEYKGERVSGCFYLCFKNIMYFWVGLPKTDVAGGSPNDLIQWEAIRWAQSNGFDYYELMDAGDDPRLRHFKSKYNPDLVIWFSAAKYTSPLYAVGERICRLLGR